jgi:hypothetical protein
MMMLHKCLNLKCEHVWENETETMPIVCPKCWGVGGDYIATVLTCIPIPQAKESEFRLIRVGEE